MSLSRVLHMVLILSIPNCLILMHEQILASYDILVVANE